jgi:excisionase family DNA binding protein
MQEKGTRFHRVKSVAKRYDVSTATIYRAIQDGRLDAVKFGAVLRIPDYALRAYESEASDAAYNAVESGEIAAALVADAESEGEVA